VCVGFRSSVDSDINMHSAERRRSEAATMSVSEQENIAKFRILLEKITESESAYVDLLSIIANHRTAFQTSIMTSKPVLSTDELNIIFCKIPELLDLHKRFLNGLKQPSASVGKQFENLVRFIHV